MPIISHKYKFIFIKPYKVGSSSVLQALGKHCGPDDIVTAPGIQEGYPNYKKNNSGYPNHMKPSEIREKISQKIWDDYLKIAIVRNPWDESVSAYNWHLKKRVMKNKKVPARKQQLVEIGTDLNNPIYVRRFKKIISEFPGNHDFYFDANGNAEADFFIKYESFEQDFFAVCRQLGIPEEPLPHMKGKTRDRIDPYWKYYNDETKKIVADRSTKIIDYFGYQFEPESSRT